MTLHTVRILAAVTGLVALGAGIGVYTARHVAAPPAAVEGLLWPNPKQLRDFEAVDQDGRKFGIENLRGRWSLLFFGYTHCPDICPITLSVLNRVQERLDESVPDDAPLQTLFVTVDPERDPPPRLAEYVRYFNRDFIGLGGTRGQVQSLASQLGVVFFKSPPQGGGDYLVDHSASVFLLDPAARLVSVFSAPHTVDGIVSRFHDIRDFIEKSDS